MSAQIIDGKALAAATKAEAAAEAAALKAKGIEPCLAVILVGENPASQVYVRGKVKEAHFVTDQSFDVAYTDEHGKSLRNIVIVTLPASVGKVSEIAGEEAAAKVEAYNKEISGEAERERLAAEEKAKTEVQASQQAERDRIAAEQVARKQAEAERLAAEQTEKERLVAEEQARLQAEETAKATSYHFALRANLLRWATLTPDLGVEWRINRHVGIAVNGSYTSWTWNDSDRRYALWEVNPEVRYYIGKEKRGYIGAMYKVGQFNYKFSETGKPVSYTHLRAHET